MAKAPLAPAIEHFPTCSPDYPEKDPGEAPQELHVVDLEGGYKAWTCKDCGASVTNLPPFEDPYWDDVREEIGRG